MWETKDEGHGVTCVCKIKFYHPYHCFGDIHACNVLSISNPESSLARCIHNSLKINNLY